MISSKIDTKTTSLLDILRSRAQYQPDNQAYIFLQNGETETGTLTYGELDRQARAIAAQLQSWQGERALLLYPSGLEFITAFFGCLYAGVVAVPVYPPKRNQKLSRLLAIANDAQAKLALTTTAIQADIDRRWQEESELLTQLKWFATDTIEAKPQEFVARSVTPESLAFLQYTSGSTGTPKGVMVTHGNIIHNQQVIQQATGNHQDSVYVSWLPLFHDMGLGNTLQSCFMGITYILMPPEAFLQKPIRWLKAISKYRATITGAPNFAYDLCVSKVKPEELPNIDLSSLEVAANGAEPTQAKTLEKFTEKFAPCGFRKSAFYPCYGLAEATLFVAGGVKNLKPVIRGVKAAALKQNSVVESEKTWSGSRTLVGCGRPYRLGKKVALVNPESLTRCKKGEVGEIWISGESVASGYWNRPSATRETFQAYVADTGEGPFLRTGDLGFKLNGELFVTGRLKDVIIIRGRNYYPQDIELTLENSHPALRSHCSAAFSVERSGEERLVLACEVERTYLRNLNTEEVVKRLRKAISEEHDLQLYAVVLLKTGRIPKTSSGKIQRHACRTGFLNGSLDVVGEWTLNLQEMDLPSLQTALEMQWERGVNGVTSQLLSASTESQKELATPKSVPTEEEIEAWLVSNLARNLNVLPDEIDVNESFADYGLDSLVAVSITGALSEWLGYELEPSIFWEYRNIKAIVLYLAKESQANSQVTINRTQRAEPENNVQILSNEVKESDWIEVVL